MDKRSAGKILILVALLLLQSYSNAQTEKELNIEVGSWVKLAPCKTGNKSFVYMDLYKKTRYLTTDTIKIDTASGEGVLEFFIKPGDFDARRLPCEYGNKKYRIAALHVFETNDNKEKRVMILYTSDKLSVIWVEFDDAYENGELIL